MKPYCRGKQKYYQSEFSRKFACWANNHRGWQKMKKMNNKIARKKIKNEINIDEEQ